MQLKCFLSRKIVSVTILCVCVCFCYFALFSSSLVSVWLYDVVPFESAPRALCESYVIPTDLRAMCDADERQLVTFGCSWRRHRQFSYVFMNPCHVVSWTSSTRMWMASEGGGVCVCARVCLCQYYCNFDGETDERRFHNMITMITIITIAILIMAWHTHDTVQ